MPASISTSNFTFRSALRARVGASLVLLLSAPLILSTAHAADPAPDGSQAPLGQAPDKGVDKTLQSEEDDFSSTPYTEYGEFNEEEDEAAETRFLQHGRFFGVSLGLGYEGVLGNRSLLWQGGFPAVELKLHYWFDFNLAMDLGFYTASHFYETSVRNAGHVDAYIFRLGVDVKYYFDTKNVAAPISFAHPYVLLGAGSFSKTETSQTQATTTPDSAFGLSFGGGLEFVMSPRKTYFALEAKVHPLTFKDTYTPDYLPSIDDLTGVFYTVMGSILFTW